jgi:hypothetical protein
VVLLGLLAFMVFLAFILALWEVQIEGKDGWAARLPTWRIENGWVLRLTGGRPLTGYHIFMTAFMVSVIHLPLFFVPWHWRLECLLLGFYFGMVLLEDFFWFVFNPNFRIKNFRPGNIWWHRGWWGPVPSFYWVLGGICIVLWVLGWGAI